MTQKHVQKNAFRRACQQPASCAQPDKEELASVRGKWGTPFPFFCFGPARLRHAREASVGQRTLLTR